MAKKDLFEFGENMSLFDLMDDFPKAGEEASEKEAVTTNEDSLVDAADDSSVETEVDEDDGSLDDDSLDVAPKTKTESKSSPKASSKKGSKDLKGDAVISLPVTCYGRNWVHTISDIGTITYNELIKLLYNEGYKEVAHSQVKMISGKGFVLFTSPDNESDTDVLVSAKTGTKIVVADGMLQMEVDATDFPDLSEEEISILHLQEKWERSAPEWKNKGLSFDPVSQIAIPVIQNTVKGSDVMTLPITVIVNGTEVDVTEEMFLLKEQITASDVLESIVDSNISAICNVNLTKRNNSVYMIQYTATAKSKVVNFLNRDFAKIGKSDIKKAVELISLPTKVYFVTLNMYFDMTPEMFGGKVKVKQEDILDVLKQSYQILRNKDRKVETVYVKEQNLLSVALVSGTKGSAYALPEAPECGLFKFIRSAAELQAVKLENSFLGFFCPDDGPSQRIEVTPTGTFIGVKGSGRESYLIKSVEWESKLPKIPKALFDTIVADFTAHSDIERILRIYWDCDNKSYQLVAPNDDATTASRAFIHYTFPSLPSNMQLIMTVHSHNTMPAYFSSTDDADEAITGIYGVVGTVNTTPTSKFRIGMEGVFSDISFDMLFE